MTCGGGEYNKKNYIISRVLLFLSQLDATALTSSRLKLLINVILAEGKRDVEIK